MYSIIILVDTTCYAALIFIHILLYVYSISILKESEKNRTKKFRLSLISKVQVHRKIIDPSACQGDITP